MKTVSLQRAKANLSELVDKAAKGEPFIITKAGKPMVKVMALEAKTGPQVRRLGFLEGQFSIPDDFDRMGSAQIQRLFSGKADTNSSVS